MSIELLEGDCLEIMPDLPSDSIDLILTDPPYGTIKTFSGKNRTYTRDTTWDVVINQKAMLYECERLLKVNAACVLFGQEPFTSKLITEPHPNLRFSYRYTWLKDHFGSPLGCKQKPLNYTEDINVFFKKYDTRNNHPLRLYSAALLDFIGKPSRVINKELKHRRSEHFFYTTSTQFNICSAAVYEELTTRYRLQEFNGYLTYNEIQRINKAFSGGQTFNLPEGARYKSNVLEYKKDYGNLHPTQKPVALLEDLIKTYTHEGATVLDFTAGSFSTGVACQNTNRNFIGIELNHKFYQRGVERLKR